MDYYDLSIRVQDNGNILASSDQGERHSKLNLDKKVIDLALQAIEEDRTDEDLLKKVGNTLYNALFDTNISKHFGATMASAKSGFGVRIRLIFEESELAAIPWEFLYDDSTNIFLANDPKTPLSRYIDIPLQKQNIEPASLPIKMLLIISCPKNLPSLDSVEEVNLIREALNKYVPSQIKIDVLTKATTKEIHQRIIEEPPNVLHFIGHGVFKNDKGYIALMDKNGCAKFLDDQGFASLFLGIQGLGLVILNACEGAEVSSSHVFSGMAPSLVQKGIPAVIAMQYSIKDETAKLFADNFYRSLALGKPVDEAVQLTRNFICIEVGRDRRDFATPVLYMRARDGIILNLDKKNNYVLTNWRQLIALAGLLGTVYNESSNKRFSSDKERYDNCILPIWEAFKRVHKDYKDSFIKYIELIKNGKNLDDLIMEIQQDSIYSRDLRYDLHNILHMLIENEFKNIELKLFLEYISSYLYMRESCLFAYDATGDTGLLYDQPDSNRRRLYLIAKLSASNEDKILSSMKKSFVSADYIAKTKNKEIMIDILNVHLSNLQDHYGMISKIFYLLQREMT